MSLSSTGSLGSPQSPRTDRRKPSASETALLIVAIMVSTPLWARMSPANQAIQRSGYSLTIRHGLGWFGCGVALYLGEGVRG